MCSSLFFFFSPWRGKDKIWYIKSKSSFCYLLEVLPHMRALEDVAVFINEAARWARIKTGWNSEILPERQNHIKNVWVLKFPNGLHFLLWLYPQVCFLKVVAGSIWLVSYLLSNVKAHTIKRQWEHTGLGPQHQGSYTPRAFLKIFIYLAVWGLSCGLWDFHCIKHGLSLLLTDFLVTLQHVGSYFPN